MHFSYAIHKSHTGHQFIDSLKYINATLNAIEMKETFALPLTANRN